MISTRARGAVNFAVTQEWLKGYEDESFRPRQNVTLAEAATVLMRVTGQELSVVPTAVWPVGHIMQAHSIGLLAGIELSPANRPLSREDMARLTYNALFVEQLEPGGDDELIVLDPLAAAFTVHGQVRAVDASGQTIVISHVKTATTAASQQTYALADQVTVVGAASLVDLVGRTVRAAINATDEVHLLEVLHLGPRGTSAFKQATGGTADARTQMELEDGSTFSVSLDTTIKINATEHSIGQGGTWPSVHAFLTDSDTGMRPGDLVTAVADPIGNAQSLEVFRLSSEEYVIDSARRDARHNVLTIRRQGSADTMAVTVPKSALIDINGHVALFTDLAPGDTVRVAVSGEMDAANGAIGGRSVDWVSVTR